MNGTVEQGYNSEQDGESGSEQMQDLCTKAIRCSFNDTVYPGKAGVQPELVQ